MNIASAITSTLGSAAPQGAEREKLAEAAKQFEAIFLRQMLTAARKTDFGGDLFGGQGLDTFRQMRDDQFARITAETGTLGLAAAIEAQLARHLAPEA